MYKFLPKYFSSKAISVYFIVLALCSLYFYNKVLPIHWIFFGALEVICFFYYSNLLTKKWGNLNPNFFKKKIFRTALSIRIIYVFFSYAFYYLMTGQPFEFASADAMGYDGEAKWLLSLIESGHVEVYAKYIEGNYSDLGYTAYLSLVYAITGKSILIARLLKALISASMCILVYKLADRNFGESTAKISGIFTMLLPNFIFYCGLHLKETEMVFLTVLFIERADLVLRQRKFNVSLFIVTLLIGLSLFLFRTVLGATAMVSLAMGFLFLSSRRYGSVKKIIFVFSIILLLFLLRGGNIEKEVVGYWNTKDSNQKTSMGARSNTNSLSTYGTTAFFAPFVLLVPFPTLINIPSQQNQMMMNGAYLIKNIIAFFVIIAILTVYKQKKISNHTLIFSFIVSYLVVIVMSKFAISERFHLPALPFLLILAAFGITQINRKNKKYYIPYIILVTFIIVGWNVFKVAGREGL